jgi:hypothetical protein
LVTRRHLASLSVGFTLVSSMGGAPAAAGTPSTLLHPTLVLGVAVPVPSGFRVGQAGAEWALPGGARLTAEAGAELRVVAAPQHLALGGHRSVPSYTVVLKAGIIRVHVPADGTTAVVVSAPRKTSVIVSAGEASVVAGPQIAVANAEGTTSVALEGSPFHPVAPGTVDVVGAAKHALLASPVLAKSPSVLLSYDKPAELQALTWDAVPGAHGYRIELRDDGSNRVLARTETAETSLAAGLAELEPGAYSLRLAAVDGVGLESAHPVTRSVRVLDVGLPPGAFVDATGVVHFPPGVSIALGHSDGVEMSFGHEGTFMPAPPSVGLFRNQPLLVRFRAASDAEPRDLLLMPRTARASVAFGPRAPSWPGAPLEIDVRVDDSSGSSEWLELEPSVSVGVEPVAVDFTREGSHLHGVLPARAGKGPWVVRVEVKDKRGMTLGRDFVEVVTREAVSNGGS